MIQPTIEEMVELLQNQLKEMQEHEAHMFKKTLSPNVEVSRKQVEEFRRHLVAISKPHQDQIMKLMAIMPPKPIIVTIEQPMKESK